MESLGAETKSRRVMFSNSRTLPGHEYLQIPAILIMAMAARSVSTL